MEILQTAMSALVVASVGLILARLAGQRFDGLEVGLARVEQRLDGRIDALDAKVETKIDALDRKFESRFDALDRKFDGLDAKFDSKFDGLDSKVDKKVDSLRADLTQIALAVGARPARETG